jgi:hypothetical protein
LIQTAGPERQRRTFEATGNPITLSPKSLKHRRPLIPEADWIKRDREQHFRFQLAPFASISRTTPSTPQRKGI